MAPNRPRGREKNVTGQGKGIKRRGSGLGTGPVGSSDGYQGRLGRRKSSGSLGSGNLAGSEGLGSSGRRTTRSGGGSVSGYGYDEKFASSGAMSLAEIDQALTAGKVKFDFVGFDVCLMATTENVRDSLPHVLS